MNKNERLCLYCILLPSITVSYFWWHPVVGLKVYNGKNTAFIYSGFENMWKQYIAGFVNIEHLRNFVPLGERCRDAKKEKDTGIHDASWGRGWWSEQMKNFLRHISLNFSFIAVINRVVICLKISWGKERALLIIKFKKWGKGGLNFVWLCGSALHVKQEARIPPDYGIAKGWSV